MKEGLGDSAIDLGEECLLFEDEVAGMLPYPAVFEVRCRADFLRVRDVLDSHFDAAYVESGPMLKVALNEALNNAQRQGERIRIKVNRYADRLVIRVRDYGAGFGGNQQLAIIRQKGMRNYLASAMDESGRGIPIILALMDRVRYNRQGNEILMVKSVV